MSTFADRIQDSIIRSHSHLVAGCDPLIEKLPSFLLREAENRGGSDQGIIEFILGIFCDLFTTAVSGKVAAVKPNIAFFEQYGIAGVSAFANLCSALKKQNIPVIIDAKRGDIGSTAAAYSAAFLGTQSILGKRVSSFEGDALTVNPFLGFDTLEPFLKDCHEHGKGIFVLVQTSNPGAKDIQGLRVGGGVSISDYVASWLARHEESLRGTCGWSGLGAVVGASYPDDARRLRELMPRNLFLIPGLGAQGADATDSVAGFGVLNGKRGGALINVSRGLLEGTAQSKDEFVALITSNIVKFNSQIAAALT